MNYYNENDPKAAAWLRELIRTKEIPKGDVDTRSITEISPHDLKGYTQHHFFAGIGGWSLALKIAGWSATRSVWTGSCPCQPFSVAGKGLGQADARHLWPFFANLINERHPPIVFGEQVASSAGRKWLAGVFADLEKMGYRRAGADLCAASVGAPHIRQRLFWMADAESRGQRIDRRAPGESGHDDERRPVGWMGNSERTGLEGFGGNVDNGNQSRRHETIEARSTSQASGNCWDRFEIIPCSDGKARRIEPGLAPLADGIPARVVRLRGYGNAIVPQVAAAFVSAYLTATK